MLTVCEEPGTARKQYFGKYAAVVVKNGPPVKGAHRGEVLVRVPGILEEDPADKTGNTQRPLEITAKPCLPPGFFFVPEPNDYLWVEFVAGELETAVWSGVWYPNDTAPKTPDGKAPTEFQKTIRTAKKHVVLLDNTDNSEQVVILDGTGKSKVTFDKNGLLLEDGNGNTVTLNAQGIEIADKNKNKITMASAGIVLENAGKKKVDIASAGVTITDTTGSAQPAALGPLLDWLLAHQHIGNMGAPTLPFPVSVAELTVTRPLLLSAP